MFRIMLVNSSLGACNSLSVVGRVPNKRKERATDGMVAHENTLCFFGEKKTRRLPFVRREQKQNPVQNMIATSTLSRTLDT